MKFLADNLAWALAYANLFAAHFGEEALCDFQQTAIKSIYSDSKADPGHT